MTNKNNIWLDYKQVHEVSRQKQGNRRGIEWIQEGEGMLIRKCAGYEMAYRKEEVRERTMTAIH